LTAAIYARKSTDQSGVSDEARSVARQVDHAKAYAARKGWTVDEALVFVDDGISGAEFASRPGFVRLMNALKPRAPFQFLVMSEESRLGREAIETAYALKQLIQAGVHVWFYLDDRERTLDSPMEKAMLALQSMSDEMEREKARQRTYDAMVRKARAGYVTSGRTFGYDNHRSQHRRHQRRGPSLACDTTNQRGRGCYRSPRLPALCGWCRQDPNRQGAKCGRGRGATSAARSAARLGAVVGP
jgi:DNA invertase Pin-like site-specific DNA recombinase